MLQVAQKLVQIVGKTLRSMDLELVFCFLNTVVLFNSAEK